MTPGNYQHNSASPGSPYFVPGSFFLWLFLPLALSSSLVHCARTGAARQCTAQEQGCAAAVVAKTAGVLVEISATHEFHGVVLLAIVLTDLVDGGHSARTLCEDRRCAESKDACQLLSRLCSASESLIWRVLNLGQTRLLAKMFNKTPP